MAGGGKVRINFSDGGEITSWLDFELTEQFSNPITTARITVAPPRSQLKDYVTRLQKGEIVGILINDRPQASLMIQTVRTKLGKSGGIVIGIEAVSPLKQLYDSTVDVANMHKSATSDVPVLQFVADTIEPFGLGEVYAEQDVAIVKTKTGKNPNATATQANKAKMRDAQPKSNESVACFIGRTLSRLGLMMHMGPIGDIYLTAPHYTGDPLYVFVAGAPGVSGEAFVGDVEIVDTNEGQWSFCEANGVYAAGHGETQTNTPGGRVTSSDINSKRPPYRSIAQLAYKPNFYRDTSCTSSTMAKSVAKLTLGLRAESAFVLRGTVEGAASSVGVPYAIDTKGRVVIPPLGIDEQMWISERTVRGSKADGLRTDLTMIPPGNFVIGDVGDL